MISSLLLTNYDHMCHQQDSFLFYAAILFYLRLNPFISNISNIYNPDQNMSLASQTICDHMIQIRSRIILSIFFGYVLVLYYVSYCILKMSTYFEYGNVLEFTVSWFLSESNRLQTEYYFPPNSEPNPKYYLEKYFKNSIE